MGTDNFNWDGLAEIIDSKQVVPVVGETVMSVQEGLDYRRITDVLADRLGKQCRVPMWPGATLQDMAARAMATVPLPVLKAHLSLIHDELFAALGDEKIGPTLRSFCQMADWPVIITTSTTDLLTRALTGLHGEAPLVVDLGIGDHSDLGPGIDIASTRLLVHLFGRISPRLGFALTEEDLLEAIGALFGETRPERLLDLLAEKHLLLLGTGFPDWLLRFFTRALRRGRLSQDQERTIAICEEGNQPRLVKYLGTIGEGISFYQGNLEELVDRLRGALRAKRSDDPAFTPSDAVVFLSYAEADRPAALAALRRFHARGLEVLDNGGGASDSRLQSGVNRALFFVPLVSRHTAGAPARALRPLWEKALARQEKQMGNKRRLIIPLLVDDIAPKSLTELPDGFLRLTMESAVGGHVGDALLDRMVDELRALRAPTRAGY